MWERSFAARLIFAIFGLKTFMMHGYADEAKKSRIRKKREE